MNERQPTIEKNQKPSRLKRWLAGTAAGLVLVGAGAVGGYFIGADRPDPAQDTGGEETISPARGNFAESASELGPMINIESFIVNILDDQGTRYLKAAITLEAEKPETAEELDARLPQIRDAILLLVGNKTFGELNDLQGKLQLRADLISRLNEILQSGTIRKIYFTEFVVQ